MKLPHHATRRNADPISMSLFASTIVATAATSSVPSILAVPFRSITTPSSTLMALSLEPATAVTSSTRNGTLLAVSTARTASPAMTAPTGAVPQHHWLALQGRVLVARAATVAYSPSRSGQNPRLRSLSRIACQRTGTGAPSKSNCHALRDIIISHGYSRPDHLATMLCNHTCMWA